MKTLSRALIYSCALPFLLIPPLVNAITLDQIYAHVQTCTFDNFYYADWKGEKPHIYFLERNMKPYLQKDGLYYFKVSETLFGLPVSEIWVPGTWAMHVVIFDVPLHTARENLRSKLHSEFRPSKKSDEGEIPALEAYVRDTRKSVFYCKDVL